MDHDIIDIDIDIDENNMQLYNIYKNSRPYFSKIFNTFILLFYFFESIFYIDDSDGISSLTKKLYFGVIDDYPSCTDNRLQLWRFITSSFLHLDLRHLLNNLIIFFPISYYFEIFYTFKKCIVILLSISFLSNFIFYYYHPYSSIIGCSHLVFGLLGSLLADYIVNKKKISLFCILKLLIPLLCISLDVVFYYFKRNENNGYIVHWSGFLIGFITGLIILHDVIEKKYNNKIRFFSSIFLFYVTLHLLYNYTFNWAPKVIDNCCYLLISNNKITGC